MFGRNALGKPQVEQKPQTGEVKQTPQTQTGKVKLMFEDVKGTAELNKKLLEVIAAVDPQPNGIKPRKLKSSKMSPGGVSASETNASAQLSLKRITDNDLKAKFERLGEKYGVPPALIAGIASRESEMGRTTKQTGMLAGWGDPRGKGNEYHGFGIIQVDKYKLKQSVTSYFR